MQSVFEKLALGEENSGVFNGEWRGGGAKIDKISPIDGAKLASIGTASDEDYNKTIARAQEAFEKWRKTPEFSLPSASFSNTDCIVIFASGNIAESSRSLRRQLGR